MSKVAIAIVGAGPYGLSLAAHLAERNVEHRIFGQPMQFWSRIADAASARFLKSYCFATDLSTPRPGFSFVEYNRPRGLETFEPCSMGNFAAYGTWFQQQVVPWVEPVDVVHLARQSDDFVLTLASGERCVAGHVVIATGLSYFASVPSVLAALPTELAIHTSKITAFSSFKGKNVAVIGAGQSALEAAALLHEAGAHPQLLVREDKVIWQTRIPQQRSLYRRLRSPISGLGTGPLSWVLTHFPAAFSYLPAAPRAQLVKTLFPAKGAWWLRDRVENRFPIHLGATAVAAREVNDRVALKLRLTEPATEHEITFDHVIAGSGYVTDVDRIAFLDPKLRTLIRRLHRSPVLNSRFETSVPGLHFIGPTSAMSFGPFFRFVIGAQYTSHVVSAHLAAQISAPHLSQVSSAA